MATKEAVELAQLVLSISNGGATVASGTKADIVGFLANQIDASLELVKECGGKPDPRLLAIALAKKGVSVGGLVAGKNDLAKCMAAVGSLGLSLAAAAISSPSGVGAYAFALSALSDAYSMKASCAGPAAAAYNKAMDKVASDPLTIRLYHELMMFLRVPADLH